MIWGWGITYIQIDQWAVNHKVIFINCYSCCMTIDLYMYIFIQYMYSYIYIFVYNAGMFLVIYISLCYNNQSHVLFIPYGLTTCNAITTYCCTGNSAIYSWKIARPRYILMDFSRWISGFLSILSCRMSFFLLCTNTKNLASNF